MKYQTPACCYFVGLLKKAASAPVVGSHWV